MSQVCVSIFVKDIYTYLYTYMKIYDREGSKMHFIQKLLSFCLLFTRQYYYSLNGLVSVKLQIM